ncbi:MmcQ/YjbR family DNA-binding protein [Planctomycetota bacterium]|nr:MmcQ/YjbR family DNA-binding protein [Planctomycetota bacterium]
MTRLLDALPGSEPSFPFGPEVRVSKVGGKMFALVALEEKPLRINLKCDPEFALVLRENNASIEPGYHMNKRHWNTVVLDGGVERDEFVGLVRHSYALIVTSLTRKKRDALVKLGLDLDTLETR